jgi:hypothetical protein
MLCQLCHFCNVREVLWAAEQSGGFVTEFRREVSVKASPACPKAPIRAQRHVCSVHLRNPIPPCPGNIVTMLSMAEILDIRGRNTARVSDSYSDFNGRIRSALLQPTGEKSLPTVLLYDERGLRLYDYIATKTPEYYLFALEEDILKNHADDIVQVMHLWDGGAVTGREIVLELGAG